MRPVLVCVACLVLLGCEARPGPTSPPATTPAPTTTETTVPEETFSLAHSFQAGETVGYEIQFSRRLSLGTEGGVEGPFAELPTSADVETAGSGVVTFEISVGDRPGTYRLATTVESDEMTMEGTIDEEPVDDPAALEGMLEMRAVPEEMDVEVTGGLDRRQSDSVLQLFPTSIVSSGLLGPVFPDREVARGEEWSFIHPDRAFGSVQVEREISGRITGQENVDGTDALVVEGQSQAGGGEVDMSAFYREFLTSFGDTAADPELVLIHQPLRDDWTAWFDPEREVLIRSEVHSTTAARLVGEAPDRSTAEPVGFELRFEIEDRLDARMVPRPES